MPKHIIDLNDVECPLTIEKELAGSYGTGSHKTLVCSVYVNEDTPSELQGVAFFIVRQYNEEVGRHTSLSSAIENYNRLP